MENTPKKSNRNGSIELMRFVFCLLVLFYHINNRLMLAPAGDIYFFANGLIGVEFFFLVSGYLMAISAEHHKTNNLGKENIRFLYNKIIKIFPVHLFALLFTVIVYFGNHIDKTPYELLRNIFDFFPSIFLLQYTGVRTSHTIPLEWYLSSMLIGMAIIYPLLLKFKANFARCVCPIIAITFIGYLCTNAGGISANSKPAFDGLIKYGVVRAIAEMSLGIFMYEVVKFLKNCKLTKGAKIRFTLLEFVCYAIVIIYSFMKRDKNLEPYMLLLLAISITLTFSEITYFSGKLNNKVSYYLGGLSLPVYILQCIPLMLLDFDMLNVNNTLKIIIVVAATLALAVGLNPVFNYLSKRWDRHIKSQLP